MSWRQLIITNFQTFITDYITVKQIDQANEIILPLSNLCGKKLSEVKALNIPSNGLVKKTTLSDCDDFANSHNQNNTEMIKDMVSDNGKQDSAMSSSASSLTSTLSLSSRSSTCSTKSLSKSVLSDREGSYNQNDFIVIDYVSIKVPLKGFDRVPTFSKKYS